ncbi:MAG TPA: hypothetical protein VNZ22_07080 [Bacillota bacterium]|nr:hypothetical protein [Bacillota bacterium]
MKWTQLFGWAFAFCLSVMVARAQPTNEADKLKQQIQQLQESFQKQQREMRANFERMIREQQAQIEALKEQVTNLQTNAPAPAVAATTTNAAPVPASAEDVDELRQRVDELTTASKRTTVNQFNPGIGFVADSIFSYTSKGQTAAGLDRPGGFDAFLRTAELNLEASVDPFAKAYGVIAGSADAQTGEAALEVEEASVITTSLPWHLTVQGGRFFAEFGRFSYIHDHDLPFVFRPLVLDRYIGGESRTDGAQVNYFFPTEHYFSFTAGLGNGFGANAGPTPVHGYRSLSGVNFWGRFSTYFDLTPNLNLETGLSGLADTHAEGTFTDPAERDRYIGGVDITLRYQPLGSTIREGYVWGTEVLVNSADFETSPGLFNHENAVGLYSYVEKKLSRRFKVGFLFDWLEDPANHNAETFRLSPYVTWNPSEFQMLRLQYSRTEPSSATGLESSDAVYLQWDAILGRHVHGFKQR